MERYLQLASNGNIRVANCSNSAQYFHLLRDQALASLPRPLIVITPKSLLRAAETSSAALDLTEGGFQPVIEDPRMADRRESVRVLLLCTGKIFWELDAHELRQQATDLAIGRVDLLDPLPLDEILAMFRSYPNLEKAYWVQEEPQNMGAWAHVQRRIGRHRPYEVGWEYIGRPRRASPSEGFHGSHIIEQDRVLREALLTSPGVQEMMAGSPPPLREPEPSAAPLAVNGAAAPSPALAGEGELPLSEPELQPSTAPQTRARRTPSKATR
jgi:2-oxoglutarate dehydrogenase E1 component